jgi:glutathione S-transferase
MFAPCCIYKVIRGVLITHRFKTYFPHIDNVYSHRSTQRHKRKRFVSHYWDCRLKGRPPGTKKSTDPDKKKRKRVARERDLCDVKVKITEYFDQQEYAEQVGHEPPGADEEVRNTSSQNQSFFGQTQMIQQQRNVNGWEIAANINQTIPQFTAGLGPPSMSRAPPKKYYTFQRVNGNGGNGKGDGVAGPHKHTLEESDRVKKNSVVRWQAKCEKDDRRKSQVSPFHSSVTFVIMRSVSTGPSVIQRKLQVLSKLWSLTSFKSWRRSTGGLACQTTTTAGSRAVPITSITSC